MKKAWTYIAVAVVLGAALILVPLITFAKFIAENRYVSSQFAHVLERLEGSRPPSYSASDVEIFAFGFIIALIAYVLFKRRTPRQDSIWFRPYLY